MKPNVLLIFADQFRGDCLGVDGHPDVKTPFLDTLAERGTRCENAYSATPSCIPARASLLTGLGQRATGRVGYKDGVPWRYARTLAGEFTRAGYQTECVGKMHVHPLRSRQGFEHVRLHDGFLHYYRKANTPYCQSQYVADDYVRMLDGMGHRDLTDAGIECNGCVARPWLYEEWLHPTNWVADNALDFLRSRDREVPFFLMASFVRPHPPFDAPAAFFDMYRDMHLRAPRVGDWAAPVGPRVQDSSHGVPDRELMRQAQIGYYACITHLDHQIGRLVEYLKGEGEPTYVLFASDHGELLGDHNLFRKSLPYEGSARVPFIISGPGIPEGRVISDVVGLRDIMPTLLDACGVEIPGEVEGRSVLRLLRGEGEWREYLHGEHTYEGGSAQFIVTDRDKYIWFSADGREQYFDLESDPFEGRDLGVGCERARYLRGKLIAELTGREEGFVSDGHLVAGRPVSPCLNEVFGEGERV